MIPHYKDWELLVIMDWRLKPYIAPDLQCLKCRGTGNRSSMGYGPTYKDIPCQPCGGTGRVANLQLEPKPPLPTDFQNYLYNIVKQYYLEHMDYELYITRAIEMQNERGIENASRYLYCIVSELTGYDYESSKLLLYRYKKSGLIECDSNCYFGTLI